MRPLPAPDLSIVTAHARQLAGPALHAQLDAALRIGHLRAAICYLDVLYQRHPRLDDALRLADLYRRCLAFRDAAALLQAASVRWPDAPEVLRALGQNLMLAQDYAQAAQVWQALIARHPPDAPFDLLRAVACFRQLGDDAAALALLDRHGDLMRAHFPAQAQKMILAGRDALGAMAQGLYLISGHNGSGKTRVGQFLQTLGYAVVHPDTQIGRFACDGFYAPVRYDLTQGDPEKEARTKWCWPQDRFDTIRKANSGVTFIAGGGRWIVRDYVSQCRAVFFLHATPEVISARLHHRAQSMPVLGADAATPAPRPQTRPKNPLPDEIGLRADRPVWQICADILASAAGASPAPNSDGATP